MLYSAEVVSESNPNHEERTFETPTPKPWKMLYSAEVLLVLPCQAGVELG
jgi:hypothetical protein